MDGEEGRETQREQGDREAKETEEAKVRNASENVQVSAWSFRQNCSNCLIDWNVSGGGIFFQVYFILHEREGARGDGCFAPYQQRRLPQRSAARRPQGGAVSSICRRLNKSESECVGPEMMYYHNK